MRITVKGANYADAGLGFSDWVKAFIYKAGVTDPAKKQAIENLNQALVDNNLWSSIYGIAFFPGSTAATQKYIFKEGETKTLSFEGSGNVSGGLQSAVGVCAKHDFSYPADSPTKFSMGVYNKTSETNPSSDTHRIMMGINNANVSGFTTSSKILISRKYWSGTPGDYRTFGQIGATNTGGYVLAGAGYGTHQTGFIQIIKDGATGTLLDGAVTAKTNSVTEDILPGGPNGITIGAVNFFGSAVSQHSTTLITFAYWGKLSVAQATIFNTIVNTFLTEFGR